jgi:hypothetical protein
VNLLGDNIDTKNLHRQLEKNPKLKHQLEKWYWHFGGGGGNSYGPFFGILLREVHRSKQCPWQWHSSGSGETIYLKQTPKTTAGIRYNDARYCPSAQCRQHCWKPPPTSVCGGEPYSLLSLSGHFHLISPFKDALRGCHLASNQEAKR